MPKTCETLRHEISHLTSPDTALVEKLDALRRFQRLEMLRIGACDLFDLFDLPTATAQLSNLADVLVEACLEIAATQAGAKPSDLLVIGMGKLGGQELNYSSDIDLLFLAKDPSAQVTHMAERLIDALARVTTEGFLYRVDMRLRPWGMVGPLVSSPDSYMTYLARNALRWEKQALLKARVIAGDRESGEKLLLSLHPLLFDEPAESVRADVFALKQRTEEFSRQQNSGSGDVKLGDGSIRDVEFAIQYLQLVHGKNNPQILSPNTLDALSRCSRAGIINVREYRVLSDGYVFLRTIEHHLQMMDYQQIHSLPDDPDAIQSLARRLGFEGNKAGEAFLARYRSHSVAIRDVYLHYVGSTDMNAPDLSEQDRRKSGGPMASLPEISQHVARMSPSYKERFTEEEIAHHAALAAQLNAENLSVVDAKMQGDGTWNVTIVAYDFPGELSLFCGLLFVHGLDITKGDVFTYEPLLPLPASVADQRKIVDVFSVRPARAQRIEMDVWSQLAGEMENLLKMVRAGQRREARSELTRRVGSSLYEASQSAHGEVVNTLYPISIDIDNETSDQYTLLKIDTPDTVGFLYEFTNALAMEQVYIARVIIDSVGNRVSDILYVTDDAGLKITQPERQRELRAATVLVKHFTHLLPLSPNPESALFHFREFLSELFKRPNWPDELSSLERPEVLKAIARLLGVSDFLWDDFLRMQYTNLFPVVTSVGALSSGKTRKHLENELAEMLSKIHSGPQPPTEDAPWREAVNSFKDREMFRIDMRHILGHTSEFWDFAAELSDLAEVIINVVYHLCHEDLRSVYGSPLLGNGEVSEMAVLALGKCGAGS
jgi:glutamate-ammonia-ligase adenylyltransferase